MTREVDADRALTEEQNWSAREHRELYDAVHTGNEPGRIGELAREWTRLGTELGESADTAAQRVRATEQGWQGAAADAARTALQRVLDWSREAGTTAHSVGDQLDHQGRIMEAAKTSMPEPVEPDPGPKRFSPDAPKDLAGLAGAAEDVRARQERARSAHDQAVEVMRRMEADSRDVDGNTPRFEPPPNPIRDSAPAPNVAGSQGGPTGADSAAKQGASPQGASPQGAAPQPNSPQGTAPSAAPPAQAPPAGAAPTPNAAGPDVGRPSSAGEQVAPGAPIASKVDRSGSGKQGSGSGGKAEKKGGGESKSDDSKDSKSSTGSGKDDSDGKKSDDSQDSKDSKDDSAGPKSTHSSSAAPPAEQTARLKQPTPEGAGLRGQSFSPATSGSSGAGWTGSLPSPSAGGGSSAGGGTSTGGGSSTGGGRTGGSGGSGESLSPGDRTGSGAGRGPSPGGGAASPTAPAGGQAGTSGMTGMAGSPGAGGMAGQGQGQGQNHSNKYVEGDEEFFEAPGDPPPPVIGARKQDRQQGRGE